MIIGGEDDTPEHLNIPDVVVRLADGSRWSATVATLADRQAVMDKNSTTGEMLADKYFTCKDLLIVRNDSLETLLEVLKGLITNGQICSELQPLRDEDVENPYCCADLAHQHK
jgi:hypothetical protein